MIFHMRRRALLHASWGACSAQLVLVPIDMRRDVPSQTTCFVTAKQGFPSLGTIAGLNSRFSLCENRRQLWTQPSDAGTPLRQASMERTAIVVRTYAPTKAAKSRILSWVEELEPFGADVWVSVDTTRLLGRQTYSQFKGVPELRVHAYSQEELLARYPSLAEACTMLPQGICSCVGNGNKSIAWGFHCECILCWWAKYGEKYDFVWVLEDDVGCDGNLGEMFACYAEHDLLLGQADLITKANPKPNLEMVQAFGETYRGLSPQQVRYPPFEHLQQGWNWYYSATPTYLHAFCDAGSHARVVSPEFVQRLSRSLLEALERWASSGRNAWSEEMTPTVCMAEGLVFRPIRDEHIGAPFKWDGRLSLEDWESCLRQASDRGTRRQLLYHALKF